MPFTRFVQIGRVALINTGCCAGKLVAIIDVVDQTRALVEGPHGGVPRQVVSFRHMSITPIKIDIGRGARVKAVTAAWTKAEVEKKWNESAWGKKLIKRQTRANLSDFDRFKVHLARKRRSELVSREFAKLKKAAKL
eukprot:TRINITY_DN1791_c0_g1::TRINITY_DN1791_c0_g1_i1::g.25269::m.25269 TRINITY_DN1791_c0_g1::TRINITY_DN1791_c0_g1_i1::g.25269  ORF type:complete len:150 (+),score=50.01,sp/P55844/RL14_PEA/52.99/3e-41,Ribosomal_L14e/PF01929.12/3.6e-29 TRINITY_DN1791_c0_g1_i1:42-452(+)